MDETDIITDDFITINSQEIIPGEVAGLYKFNPNMNLDSSLSHLVELELILKRIVSFYPVHVYHLDNLDDGWKRIDDIDYIMDPETNTISINTDKFGYYIIIQNKYLIENPKKISEL
jgi:hypothetical protein